HRQRADRAALRLSLRWPRALDDRRPCGGRGAAAARPGAAGGGRRMTITIVLAIMFAMLIIGTPVAIALAVAGSIGLYMIGGMPMLLGILETTPLSTVTSYELITIPMFILMAEFVILSGIADD